MLSAYFACCFAKSRTDRFPSESLCLFGFARMSVVNITVISVTTLCRISGRPGKYVGVLCGYRNQLAL